MFAQGEDFFRHLATHEQTALFVCRKLATFFIEETPSTQLVQDLAGVYKKSSGNLRDVYRHLFLNEDFFNGRFGAKAKRPLHFVMSSLRSVSASVSDSVALERWLTYMGELVFTNPNPGGYKDQSQMWLTADLALIRFQFIIDLIEGLIPGVHVKVKNQRATIEKLSGPLFQMR